MLRRVRELEEVPRVRLVHGERAQHRGVVLPQEGARPLLVPRVGHRAQQVGAREPMTQRWWTAQHRDRDAALLDPHRLDAQVLVGWEVDEPPALEERARLVDGEPRLGEQAAARDGGVGDRIEHRPQQRVVVIRARNAREAVLPAGARDLDHLRARLVERRARTVLDGLRAHRRADSEAQRPVDVRRTDSPVDAAVVDELVHERRERLEPLHRVLAGVARRVDLEPDRLGVRRQPVAHQRERTGEPLLDETERRRRHTGEQPPGLLEHRGDPASTLHGRLDARSAVLHALDEPTVVTEQVEDPAGRVAERDRGVDGERGPLLELDPAPADGIEQQPQVALDLASLAGAGGVTACGVAACGVASATERAELQLDGVLEV